MLFLSSFPFPNVTTGSSIIYVPDDYPTIQEAINAANDGDTIYVRVGTYYENIVVNKSIALIGKSQENAVLDGNNTGTVICVTSDSVTIANLTVQNAGRDYDVICLINVTDCIIRKIKIMRTIDTSGWNRAIRIVNSFNNTVSEDIIWTDPRLQPESFCHAGIELINCSNNVVSENEIYGCLEAFSIQLINSCNNKIANNTIKENHNGIYIFSGSSNNTIMGNTVQVESFGICLREAHAINLIDNIVHTQDRIDIYLSKTNYSLIVQCSFLNDEYGGKISQSYNNSIFNNNFLAPLFVEQSINRWDNGYPSGGNYWSDYAGFDLYSGPYQNETGRDCIGDTPYTIDENNQDLYPLIYPYPIDPWGDIDDDGIPNYLDRVHFKVMNFTYPNDIVEWNTTWHFTAYFLEPSQSSSQFLLALSELGISNDLEYNTTFGLIFEIENPFNNATEFLNWFEKYHLITVENQSEASNYLSTFLSSDGMFRILLLFKYNSITDWGIDSYIIHNPVPIAAAVITIAIDVSLMIFSWWIRQEKDIEQGQQFNPETTMEMAKGTLLSSIYMIISSLASLASIKISAILGVVGIVIGVAEVLSAWQDPLIDLHIYNSTRHHVLGIDYSTGVVQTYFSHGLYSGRTDAMQLVLLSKDQNGYNATVISKASNKTSFFFNIYDLQLNKTIKSNGILWPEEVVSTWIYFITNETFANQLFLTAEVPKVVTKGETMQIEIQLRDENLTSVDDALVKVLISNETYIAMNTDNGKYVVSIDTTELGIGEVTLTIIASKDGYLGAKEDFIITVIPPSQGGWKYSIPLLK